MRPTNEAPILTEARIDQLVDALRVQGAPIVDHLLPGLTDPEIDGILAPLGITAPMEARTWWGTHNGVPVLDGGHSPAMALTTSWWWAPLDRVAAKCQLIREQLADFEGLWLPAWLPIVIGDGELVIDTAVTPGGASPVHVIDLEGDEFDRPHTPVLPSLGALIQLWTSALRNDVMDYRQELGVFLIDPARFDRMDPPGGVL